MDATGAEVHVQGQPVVGLWLCLEAFVLVVLAARG